MLLFHRRVIRSNPVDTFIFAVFLLLCLLALLYVTRRDDRRHLSLPPEEDHRLLQDILRYMEQHAGDSRSTNRTAAANVSQPQLQGSFFEENATKVIRSGYLRSEHVCMYANADLTALEAKVCGSADLPQDKARMLFQWTNLGHLMVMGRCATHDGSALTLDYCYRNNPHQVWTQPTADQFINTAHGYCLRIRPSSGNNVRTLHVADCWKGCVTAGFGHVTWFLVDSPDAAVPAAVLQELLAKEEQPWQRRYCLNYKNIVLKNQ